MTFLLSKQLIIEMLMIYTAVPYFDCRDLSFVYVVSGIEAFQILQYGLHNLRYAATGLNAHSSRSHGIFSIKLVQYARTAKTTQVSYFNFCDLAGSERLKKTLNVGDRLKESNSINKSLHVLGEC